MLRTIGIGAALLTAHVASAQSTLQVFSPDGDQTFHVSLTDHTGLATECTLRNAGSCRLSLSPGPLQIDIRSNGRSLDDLLTLPPGPSGLELKYRTPAMGWVGVGLLGGGTLEVLLGALLLGANTQTIAANNGGLSSNDVRSEYVALAALSFVSAAALFVTGGILTGLGFHRAGPHAELTSPNDAPVAYPPPPQMVPPPPSAIPPPPSAPPVVWEGSDRSDL